MKRILTAEIEATDNNSLDALVEELARASCDIANSTTDDNAHIHIYEPVPRVREALEGLLTWERHMGGWVGRAWEEAREAVAEAAGYTVDGDGVVYDWIGPNGEWSGTIGFESAQAAWEAAYRHHRKTT